MRLKQIINQSKKFYQATSMILKCPTLFRCQNFPDEEILKKFDKNKKAKAIVIAGMDPMNQLIELRSFIFSARKHFNPGNRPLIIIYTHYYFDELKDWSGVESEMLQYGNVLLKCGRPKENETMKYFNHILGIPLCGRNQIVYEYIGHQYE